MGLQIGSTAVVWCAPMGGRGQADRLRARHVTPRRDARSYYETTYVYNNIVYVVNMCMTRCETLSPRPRPAVRSRGATAVEWT
jgi:hypothetical protein